MRHIVRVSLLALISASVVSGCQPEAGNEAVNDATANRVSPLPRIPVVEPPMDRAALLKSVADAASAAALGQDDAAEQRLLDGKRFEVRIRFGCAPTTPSPPSEPKPGQATVASKQDAPFNVRFNEEARTLRIRAAPDLNLDDPTVASISGEGVEAVEGFWMNRPWLLSDGCAVAPSPPPEKATAEPAEAEQTVTDAAEPARAGQRVGLAQFFTTTDPRTQRRDHRAYETTKVLPEGKLPSRQGYNLVLSGRLRQPQGNRVIACRLTGPDKPPECVVSAEFDRVWMEDPASRDVIAEWGS